MPLFRLLLPIYNYTLGYSQREMAKQLDSSLGALQSYESGKSVPGGNVLEALARLGFNTNWILTGEEAMRRGNRTYAIKNAERQFESIQPDTIEKILEGFDTLKDSGITIDNLNKAIVLSIAYEYFRYYKKTVPDNIKRFVLAYLYVMEDMPASGRQEHMFELIDKALERADGLTIADLPVHRIREIVRAI